MGGPNCVDGKCLIPGGPFMMGSPKGVGLSDVRPQRRVTMSAFKIGQTEVSVSQYRAYLHKHVGIELKAVLSGCGSSGTSKTIAARKGESKAQLRKRAARVFVSNSCDKMEVIQEIPKGKWSFTDFHEDEKGDNYPVVGLTFDEKRAYCQAQGGDLATAAQLHFVSRYDDQDSKTGRLVTLDNGFKTTEPVDAGYKNRFGVYNLLGNVWESSLDAYNVDFYVHMPLRDPYYALTDQNRQLQEFSGGSFFNNAGDAPPAYRGYGNPNYRYFQIGFRCAWPADSK